MSLRESCTLLLIILDRRQNVDIEEKVLNPLTSQNRMLEERNLD